MSKDASDDTKEPESDAELGHPPAMLRDCMRRLHELMGSENESTALRAAMTIADRFGAPVTTKTEATLDHRGPAFDVQIVATEEQVREWAREPTTGDSR